MVEMKQKYVLPLTWLSSSQGVSLCICKYYKIQNAFQQVKINKNKAKALWCQHFRWCTDPATLVNVSILSRHGQSWGSRMWPLVLHFHEKEYVCIKVATTYLYLGGVWNVFPPYPQNKLVIPLDWSSLGIEQICSIYYQLFYLNSELGYKKNKNNSICSLFSRLGRVQLSKHPLRTIAWHHLPTLNPKKWQELSYPEIKFSKSVIICWSFFQMFLLSYIFFSPLPYAVFLMTFVTLLSLKEMN